MSITHPLGAFLKDHRARLDPAAFGFPLSRRRTPGLRREEVAQRANVSPAWYTWLEQGRGGTPSAHALGRIAQALMLSDVEREHLFFLALGRPPEAHYHASNGVPPRLQHLLDALEYIPATIKTATWDIVAWNRAAAAVLMDYATLAPDQRNELRLLFCDRRYRATKLDWESCARFAVATFRADVVRAGATEEARPLIEELSSRSAEFDAMWHSSDVRMHSQGTKRLQHPRAGTLALEYSAFAVDDRPDLRLVICPPATPGDAERIKALFAGAHDAAAVSCPPA